MYVLLLMKFTDTIIEHCNIVAHFSLNLNKINYESLEFDNDRSVVHCGMIIIAALVWFT